MCDRDKCISILRENKARIQREFDVASMAVFGSVARETNTSGSDIDILVVGLACQGDLVMSDF